MTTAFFFQTHFTNTGVVNFYKSKLTIRMKMRGIKWQVKATVEVVRTMRARSELLLSVTRITELWLILVLIWRVERMAQSLTKWRKTRAPRFFANTQLKILNFPKYKHFTRASFIWKRKDVIYLRTSHPNKELLSMCCE